MAAYYNEIEPYAAAWLRNLIKAGLIADGEVDERSIVDVGPAELREFTQCHFFAGIGVWSYALRLAGWPDDRPVWTGSCPCQPFSAAGKGKGFEDERHLWPVFHRLISECRPPVVFGEQVASKDGLGWLDTVFSDLEGSGYAAAAADLCAAGLGAPHIRQRLWFVGERLDDTASARHDGAISGPEGEARDQARLRVPGEGSGFDGVEHAEGNGREERWPQSSGRGAIGGCGDERVADASQGGREERGSAWLHADWQSGNDVAGRGEDGGLGDHHHHQGLEGQRSGHQAEGGRLGAVRPAAEAGEPRGMADANSGQRDRLPDGEGRERDGAQAGRQQGDRQLERGGSDGGMADANGRDASAEGLQCGGKQRQQPQDGGTLHSDRPCPTNGHWRDADWLHCRDGRWRPVEPGTFPLAHGAPSRVGRLRAYGNAIIPQVAAEVIGAYLETENKGERRD